MATGGTSLLPGVYPHIVKLKPKLGGVNNLGVGEDVSGLEYVLKPGPLGVAEFVGAAICREVGIPYCKPAIVTATHISGAVVHLFGSIVEPHVLKFGMRSLLEWHKVVAEIANSETFTDVLAVDLCVGNDDRHLENWIVRGKDPAAGRPKHLLLSVDYSNSWPVFHPAQKPTAHAADHTWAMTKYWPSIGVEYHQHRFRSACARISFLNSSWLRRELDPLVGVWLTDSQRDVFCDWWRDHWQQQVIDVIAALESDGDWL